MRLVLDFIRNHSSEDLMILGFFIIVGATVAGWIIDATVRERGFGVIGNGILIVMGSILGIVASQMQGPVPSMLETTRVMIFSTGCSALALVTLCGVKSRFSVV
jgi:uncharacterized membrane protein YeaQ/YmgE (transglycosylase-associated protein family)